MAGDLSIILMFLCVVVQCLHTAKGTDSIYCHQLKLAFPMCSCSTEEGKVFPTLDCSDRQLQQVPIMNDTYGHKIYKLILRNNIITSLVDSSFQGLRIEFIDLSGNSLVSVENNTFLSMKEDLQTLIIEGDRNSSPPIHALKILKVIETLTLRNYQVPYLEDHLFLAFNNLKHLTLDRWNMEHIEGFAFLGLQRLKSLSLLNQKLFGIPINALSHDPFDYLETLRISHNPEIKTVSHQAFFKLSKLKNLDLSNNQIRELETNCFAGVTNTLANINLRGNILDDGAGKLAGLSGMNALEELDLSKNSFKAMPQMPNLGLTKPLKLMLEENEIDKTLENSFTGYGQYLKDLDLSLNMITEMHPLSFKGVTQLRSLNLRSQGGGGTDSSALELPISLTNSSSTLQTIDLSWQKVDPVNLWRVVEEMTSLVNIKLNTAQLSYIQDNAFAKATTLESIDLGFNALSEITQKSLFGARHLKELDLTGNRITSISSCLFHGILSPIITLSLSLNPIKCDCRIKKLLEDSARGRIDLKDHPTYGPATCDDRTELTSLKSEDLICSNSFEEPTCMEYPTPTNPPPTDPVTNPNSATITLKILEVGIHSIKASWTLSDTTNLDEFKFQVSSANEVTEFTRENINKSMRMMEATGLPAGTYVTLCVTAYFYNKHNAHHCLVHQTNSKDTTPDKQDLEDDGSDSTTTGIIVGCVVAGVALIGIVIAVLILLVLRKKPKQPADSYRPPTQPRSFAKAELPSMSDDSRTFAKPKKKGISSSSGGNMQVVAISDGQTSPGARVGRANMMFEPEDGYEPMKNFKKNGGSMYENDHGALPPTPGPDRDSRPPSYPHATGGYYNQGFNEDKYDEIEVEI